MTSIRFKNKELFGDNFDAYKIKAEGNIMELLIKNKINKNGNVSTGSLSELWSYIYILFLFNKQNEIFKQMKSVRGPLRIKGNAKRFIQVVLEYTNEDKISEKVLIKFINKIVTTHKLNNPILQLVKTNASSITKLPSKSNIMQQAKLITPPNNPIPIVQEPKIKQPSILKQQTLIPQMDKSNVDDIKDIIDFKGDDMKRLADIIKKELKKNKLIDELVEQSKHKIESLEKSINPLKDRIYYLESDNKKLENTNRDLEKLKMFAQKETSTTSNDINEIITILKAQLVKQKIKTPIKEDCSTDLNNFKQNLRTTLSINILSKICIVKIIADILNEKNSRIMCDKNSDISEQKEKFDKLPESRKEKYKNIFNKNKKFIFDYRDYYVALLAEENIECKKLPAIKQEYAKQIIHLDEIFRDFSNINEDLLGSVRVYIKLRKFINGIDSEYEKKLVNIEFNDNTKITMKCNNVNFNGNFFGTFDENFKNADLYTGALNTKPNKLIISNKDIKPFGLKKSFDQLLDGYSISILTFNF